ncbi:MAG: CARDB domain-containing protein, partial [Longimicrobiales bacterium]
VNPATVTTAEDGTAQTAWTMGPAVGSGTLTAVVTGFPPVGFTANALAATPDLVAGTLSFSPPNPTTLETVTVTVPITNDGSAATGVAFSVQLLVDGVDAASPPLGTLTSSSTQTIGPLAPSETANAEFTVGPFASGTRSLSVVVDPTNVVAESDETNNTAVQSLAVVTQTALLAGTPIPNIGAAADVELLFAFQLPVADGLSIDFTFSPVTTGHADMYVNYSERPQAREDYECFSHTSCRFEGALTGTYNVLIHAFEGAFTGGTLSVTTGLDVLPFNIELVFINSGSTSQTAAFTSAAARWESIVPFDIVDIPFQNQPVEANTCTEGQPPIEDTVDDLRIFVDIIDIDGPGGVLGQAGPCITRSATGLPVVGIMQFDIIDLDRLETAGQLIPTILHEMGHVLGIGTIWGRSGLLRNPSVPADGGTPGADTHFTGPLAITAFDDAGGTGYTGGEKVPVENSGEEGSADGHWRESLFGNELMSPVLNSGVNPLSAISIQSLADVGYRVDLGPADPYSRVFTAAAPALELEPVIDLRADIRRGPIFEVDDKGRIVRIINR